MSPDHPIWKYGVISPISQVISVPIYFWREDEELPLEATNIEKRDTQSVTYMMIKLEDGFAPVR